MDLSRAQLEAFRALHYFHEKLNVHIKSSAAGIILLADAAGSNNNPRHIGELIERSHPAWNSSPIHSFDVDLYRQIYCSVGAYAVVAIFSALDDFTAGLDADISRYESAGNIVCRQPKANDNDQLDPIEAIYKRYSWPSKGIENLLPVLKYFRLMRNCLAHRASRASHALSNHSKDGSLQVAAAGLLDRTTESAPTYEYNEQIFVDPALAISCSDVIRKVAEDCNRQFIGTLGVEGFLLLVCQNLEFPHHYSTAAFKSPEAVLNLALVERYRVGICDGQEAPKEVRRLGLWKAFHASYQRSKK